MLQRPALTKNLPTTMITDKLFYQAAHAVQLFLLNYTTDMPHYEAMKEEIKSMLVMLSMMDTDPCVRTQDYWALAQLL